MSRSGKKKYLKNHQKSWVWGRYPVKEILRAGKWSVLDLYIGNSLSDQETRDITILASSLGIEPSVCSSERLYELCHSKAHQGCVARMSAFPYTDPAALKMSLKGTCSLVALLDSIQDPYNFGAIIRSAEVFGFNGIIIPSKNQTEVTSLVARTSSGAVNTVPIVQVDDVRECALDLLSMGIGMVGALETGQTPVYRYDFTQPTGIIMGNESDGIQADLLELCETRVRIPQYGHIGSLNVAAAASVVFYEATRQRENKENGG